MADLFDDALAEQERLKRERRRKAKRREEVIFAILAVVMMLAIIALVIWVRNAMPCDWLPAREAPARCFTGVSR